MNGAQGKVRADNGRDNGEMVGGDDELINLLVPPRRPRWQVAVAIAGVAVVVAGILVINRSGVLTPRVTVTADQLSAENHQATATFVIKNNGWTTTKVSGIGETSGNLHNARVVSTLPQSIDPGKTATVVVRFDVDCDSTTSGDQTGHLDVKARSTLPITVTQTHDVFWGGSDWATELHNSFCERYPANG